MYNNIPICKIYLKGGCQVYDKQLLKLIDAALKGSPREVEMEIKRLALKIRESDTDLYKAISDKISSVPLRSTKSIKPIPVDPDSRQPLVRVENAATLKSEPIHSKEISSTLRQVILEREHSEALLKEELFPTRSMIFQGPPGVGKTMSARWLSKELNLPLLILDLATVMSSFLGKTGSNVRAVLEYAMSFPCILLLDEFDAVAKRRDDDRELGELKRLVTVLLQAVDDWPSSSILIAATNHGELLDPAIWRRFDLEVTFKIPDEELILEYIEKNWSEEVQDPAQAVVKYNGYSFSYIDREIRREKREDVISRLFMLPPSFSDNKIDYSALSITEKKKIAVTLKNQGLSQRNIANTLGISRPTVKKAIDEHI